MKNHCEQIPLEKTRLSDSLQKHVDEINTNLLGNLKENNEHCFRDIAYQFNLFLAKAKKEIRQFPPEEAFAYVSGFLNSLFSTFQVRKFYNNMPNVGLRAYANKSIGEQLVNNLFDKHWNLVYDKNIKGGSCHEWALLFKSLFDTLKIPGLESKLGINTKGVHSFLLIRFQDQYYLADMYGFNEAFGQVISPADQICNGNMSFDVEEYPNYNMKLFDSTGAYIDYKRDHFNDEIRVSLKPKNLNYEDERVEVCIDRKEIFLKLPAQKGEQEKVYRVSIDPKDIAKKISLPLPEILYLLIRDGKGTKESKQLLSSYVPFLAEKMNKKGLLRYFQQ